MPKIFAQRQIMSVIIFILTLFNYGISFVEMIAASTST